MPFPPSSIRTVDRTFSILRIVARHPNGIGVSAVAAEVGLAKSTVSRLLATMEQWEVVVKRSNGLYEMGPEPTRWVSYQPFGVSLAVAARPLLQEIADATGEATALCVLDGDDVAYLDNIQSVQDIQVRDWTGEKLPLHVISAGKVLLAFAGEAIQQMYLQRPLLALTRKSIVDPIILQEQLETVRQQGFAVADEEFADGVMGIAVPLKNSADQVIAALCVYGPRFRMGTVEQQQTIIATMQDGAAKFEAQSE